MANPPPLDSPFVKWPTENTTVFAGEFISLRSISQQIGLSYQYLSRVFQGQRQISIPTAQRIADCLDMPFEKFMRGLDIHIAARKIYGKNLPLLVPKYIKDSVDNTLMRPNTDYMPESCLVDNPTPQTIRFNNLNINLSAISRMKSIDTSYLSRIFSGERTPSIKHAKKIASALGMSLESFLDSLDTRVQQLYKDRRK